MRGLQLRLEELLDEGEEALRRRGARALSWVERYRWETIERRYDTLYRSLLVGGESGRKE